MTGGWLAVAFAVAESKRLGRIGRPVLRDQVAAVSVGHVSGELALDLCYAEDSVARVDLNLVATAKGAIVEIQGTAEGEAVPRGDIDSMIDLGLEGIAELVRVQSAVLSQAGVDPNSVLIGP